MTRLARSFRLLIFFFIIILGACSTFYTPETLPPIQGLSSTLAIQTMVANPNLIFLVQTPTPTTPIYTPTQYSAPFSIASTPVATSTPIPSVTLVPSLTPMANLSGPSGLNSTTGECINAAEFVEDVTIPDDTMIKPGKPFTKIWKLRNIGSCPWTTNYSLVFVAGDQMKGIPSKKLGTAVDPGQTIDLSMDLEAPKEMNYYQGNWMLQDENGDTFGTGSDADGPFWVSIKVYAAGWQDIFGNGGVGGGGVGIKGGCRGGG